MPFSDFLVHKMTNTSSSVLMDINVERKKTGHEFSLLPKCGYFFGGRGGVRVKHINLIYASLLYINSWRCDNKVPETKIKYT